MHLIIYCVFYGSNAMTLVIDFLQVILLMLMFIKMAIELVNVINDKPKHLNYVRVTRALRPIFLLDNHLMSGVRRYIFHYY